MSPFKLTVNTPVFPSLVIAVEGKGYCPITLTGKVVMTVLALVIFVAFICT